MLQNCDDPEAKEALKILNQNDKLLHRKTYLDYSDDEITKRAKIENNQIDLDFVKAQGGAKEVADQLNKKYSGKTFECDYDIIKINKIVCNSGYLGVIGTSKTKDYLGEHNLSNYELRQVGSLNKLADIVDYINDKTNRNYDADRYYNETKNDKSDRKRQGDIAINKLNKEKYGKRTSKVGHFQY